MKIAWKRFGAGLGGALGGAALGGVMGFIGTYLVIAACAGVLGFSDQDGLIVLAGGPFGAVHGGVVGLLIGFGVRRSLGWGLGALVGLGLWAPLFLWGAHHKSTVVLLLAYTMPLWCGGIGALGQALLAPKKARQLSGSPGEAIRDDRVPTNPTPMQIAGSTCKACERTIVLSKEGKFCVRCGTVVHCGCEPRLTCDVCGEPYHAYEHAEVDPVGEAILPAALRPGNSGGGAMAMICAAVFVLLAMLLLYSVQYALEHSQGK